MMSSALRIGISARLGKSPVAASASAGSRGKAQEKRAERGSGGVCHHLSLAGAMSM